MKTVGHILLTERKKKKWTLEEVQKFTKIHPSYIKALEADDYSIFQGRVHAKGFLKIYAEFLELNVNELMAFWRRENDSDPKRHRNTKKEKERLWLPKKIKMPVVAFSYKTGAFLLALGMFLIFFSYVFYQYKRYSQDPVLIIVSPKNNSVSESNFVSVKGRTEKESEFFINNQPVPVDDSGEFETAIKLSPGVNTLNIFVKNKLGNTAEKSLTVIYKQDIKIMPSDPVPESTQSTSSIEKPNLTE
jgi:cytoskeletal protein RodZ